MAKARKYALGDEISKERNGERREIVSRPCRLLSASALMSVGPKSTEDFFRRVKNKKGLERFHAQALLLLPLPRVYCWRIQMSSSTVTEDCAVLSPTVSFTV